MKTRRYFSTRLGADLGEKLDLQSLVQLVKTIYVNYSKEGYFQEYFGTSCVDGDIEGKAGRDLSAYALLKFRRQGIFPFDSSLDRLTQVDVFDLIEFLFDHVSEPVDGYYHDFCRCGWHYEKFNGKAGQLRYQAEVNQLLHDYEEGWELSIDGEIRSAGHPDLKPIFDAELPSCDEVNVKGKVKSAVKQFRDRNAGIEGRKNAVRELADVLEYIRPQVKNMIHEQDERDLFNIANNFSIRHHNQNQKDAYDKPVWLSWMFYHYLATIHVVLRLMDKEGGAN